MAILRLDTNPSKVLGKRLSFKMHIALTVQGEHKELPLDLSVRSLCWFNFGVVLTMTYMIIFFVMRCCYEAAASKKHLWTKSIQGILPQNLYSYVKEL